MEKNMVVAFNTVYVSGASAEEKQILNDMLSIWGRLDTAVAKNPATYRRGILFGLAMEKAISKGEILLRPVREKKRKTAIEE